MTGQHHDEVITISLDEHEALKAEVRRLRREIGRQQAMRAIMDNNACPGTVQTFSREELAAEWGISADRSITFPKTADAQAIFATVPAIDWDEVRAEWDAVIDDSLHDPFEGLEPSVRVTEESGSAG
ncbi:hypothetical protein ACIBG8_19665 [Nonomuraea sp. NPDC050556]|uniref:hypothetical protein n=1 Tax=Nonomuraea sp. NPDC050556 TaxID=3364369 RepID=UPI003798DF93